VSLIRVISSVLIIVVLVACQTTLPKGVTPEKATWLYGYYTIPGQFTRSNTQKVWRQSPADPDWMSLAAAEVRPNSKVPVVLYLHGCAGMRSEDYAYRELMLEQGYAVFMPDSFKRPYRRECSSQGRLSERVDMRTVEVITALQELKQLPWVDQENIILMGFSEGGNTTDHWSRPGFKAHIILGSACTLTGGEPNAPAEVPVLAIVGARDSFRPGKSCRITRTVGGSRSVIIPDADHWISGYSQTREEIRNFLQLCCKKS